MGGSLVITLREGLEAGLIVAIILAYLRSSNQQQYFKTVLLSALAAVAVSIAVGAAIFAIAGEFEGKAEIAFEGGAMLMAAGVLSWMIIWMKRQSVGLRRALEHDVAHAIGSGSFLALALIPFSAILREGLETSVFLFASTETSTPFESTLGASLGLLIAAALTWGIYTGGYRINLKTFFNITGVLLIFFAAGLLVHGIHELQEISVLPTWKEHVWDINGTLNEDSEVGKWLKALLGYNANPSLLEVIAYPIYLVGAFVYFFTARPQAPRLPARPTPSATPPARDGVETAAAE
jgi:high-affinity iron transporter